MNKREERLTDKVFDDVKELLIERFNYNSGLSRRNKSFNKVYKSMGEYLRFRLKQVGKKNNIIDFKIGKDGVGVYETYPNPHNTRVPQLVVDGITVTAVRLDGSTFTNKIDYSDFQADKGTLLNEGAGILHELQRIIYEANMYVIKLLLYNGNYFVDANLIKSVKDVIISESDEDRITILTENIDEIIRTNLNDEVYCLFDIQLAKEPYFLLEAIMTRNDESAYSMAYIQETYTIARKVGEIPDQTILVLSNMSKAINALFVKEIEAKNV